MPLALEEGDGSPVSAVIKLIEDRDTPIINMAIVASGESLFKLGKTDKADRIFKEYLIGSTNNTWVYTQWADLYNPKFVKSRGNKDKAIQLYRKALENSSNIADL